VRRYFAASWTGELAGGLPEVTSRISILLGDRGLATVIATDVLSGDHAKK
jgi:hypothetical protein